MKLITFHRKNVHVSYKNSVCSFASLFFFAITLASIIIPFYIVMLLSPRVWSENVLLWEQPQVQFKYQYNFVGRLEDSKQVISCSSFPYQRSLIDSLDKNISKSCSSLKVRLECNWTFKQHFYPIHAFFQVLEEDWNYDGKLDQIELKIKSPQRVAKFSLQLIFDLQLKVKNELNNYKLTLKLILSSISEILPLSGHPNGLPLRNGR